MIPFNTSESNDRFHVLQSATSDNDNIVDCHKIGDIL